MYKIFKSGIAADREGMECPESSQTVLRNPEHTEPGFKLLFQVRGNGKPWKGCKQGVRWPNIYFRGMPLASGWNLLCRQGSQFKKLLKWRRHELKRSRPRALLGLDSRNIFELDSVGMSDRLNMRGWSLLGLEACHKQGQPNREGNQLGQRMSSLLCTLCFSHSGISTNRQLKNMSENVSERTMLLLS